MIKLISLFRLTKRGDLHRSQRLRVGREDKRTKNRTMFTAAVKNNAAAGYQGPVKIELLKDAGLLYQKAVLL